MSTVNSVKSIDIPDIVALFAILYPNAIANADTCAFVSEVEYTSNAVLAPAAPPEVKSCGRYGRTTAAVVVKAKSIGLLYPVVGSVDTYSPAVVVETK